MNEKNHNNPSGTKDWLINNSIDLPSILGVESGRFVVTALIACRLL